MRPRFPIAALTLPLRCRSIAATGYVAWERQRRRAVRDDQNRNTRIKAITEADVRQPARTCLPMAIS